MYTLVRCAHLAGVRPVAHAQDTEANELRHSRLVVDSTSSRKPSPIYLGGLETAGQGLPRALSFFVFGHHTDENVSSLTNFSVYHIILCHSNAVFFIFNSRVLHWAWQEGHPWAR